MAQGYSTICDIVLSMVVARLAGALIGAALIGFAPNTQAPPPPATLVTIDITGISRYVRSDVIALSGLTPGQTLTPTTADAAASRLADTGLFARVAYRFETTGSDLRLTFDVVEERWTVPVVFDNFVWFSDEELIRELRQRVPTFDGMLPPNGKAADFVTRELQSILDGRGIHGRVDSLLGSNRSEAKAYVFVIIDAGDATRVCAVQFEGASPSIARELGRTTGLTGSLYSRTSFDGLVNRALLPIYRQRRYFRADFGAPRLAPAETASCSGIAVTVKVAEGLRYAWKGVRWSGNTALSAGDLNRRLALRTYERTNPRAIGGGLASARITYMNLGYLRQSASFSVTFDDVKKQAALSIVVDEGPQFHMGELTFSGFSAEDEATLRKQWRLRAGDPFEHSYPGRFVHGITFPAGGSQDSRPAIEAKTQIDEKTHTVAVAIVLSAFIGPVSRPAPATLPTVIAADVPQYPRDAAKAGISGTVAISVTTDGHKVVAARVLNSQPGTSTLGEAAVRNVRSWRFVAHEAAAFDTTFLYQIVDRPCDSLGRDTHAAAIIHFPAEVEIFSERDPACPGATPLPPVFGIYIKEAAIPFYPPAARARGVTETVRISMTYKGVLSVAEGPDELGQPIINAMRDWTFNAGPYTEEMRFTYTLVNGECRGGPVVTIGPGLTRYDIVDTRSCGR